ncbi:MAG: DUF3857 domain-containing protein, partial [Bacteroidota bacterium]|nr:DUF3857 domain-containing protein [Bacteroidota bacterium]MDX5431497.1 DUF3857 domain-containing protein [Bacteroidota bacterium]MDX5470221.1 DUF3857 domain-containing protein [Bacteroidota bacterium]
MMALVLGASCAMAQPTYDFTELKARHKGENAVIIKNNRHFDIRLKKGQLAIQSESTFGFTVLEDKARISGEHEVSYSPGFYEIKDISAASYVLLENGKYQKQKVNDFQDYSDYSGSFFYDDSRHKKFYFSGLKGGTYAEESHTYNYLRPQFLGGHYFQPGYWACEESVLTVSVDEGIEIAYSLFGNSENVQYSTSSEKGKTIHRWELKNAPARKLYSDAVSSRHYTPHVYIRVKSYTQNGQKVPVLRDLNDLYRFNYDFIKDVNTQETSPEIVRVVDSLMMVNDDTDSLIQNIFYWVQNNIKYI